MTLQEELHQLVDQLDEPETAEVLDFARWLLMERTGPLPDLCADQPTPWKWGRA